MIFCNFIGTKFHIHITFSSTESGVYNRKEDSGLIGWLSFFKILMVSTREKSCVMEDKNYFLKIYLILPKSPRKNAKELLCTVDEVPEMKGLFSTTSKCTVYFTVSKHLQTFDLYFPMSIRASKETL